MTDSDGAAVTAGVVPVGGDTVTATAPATVANVVAAFDVLGLAVATPVDTVTASRCHMPGVRLRSITGDGGALPLPATQNTAGAAVAAMLDTLGGSIGIELTLAKGLPLCSGLGSSAASAAAAVVAVNRLLGEPFERRALLPFVVAAEAVACGTAHADNAAPSLLGGCCLVRSTTPLDVVSLPVPDDLCCALVHPHCEVRTEDARRILRHHLPLERAVEQWSNVAGLIAGLCTGDLDLVGRSLRDVVIEPVRSILIPGFASVKAAAIASAALGCGISGSGPTVFALCRGETAARTVAEAMVAAFTASGLSSDRWVSAINGHGARIVASVDQIERKESP
jgi:homoserine kinase